MGDDGRMKAAIIIGSDSDWPIMKPAAETLKQFGVEANIGLRNMRIPYKLEYYNHWEGTCLTEVRTIEVKGTTYLHTVSLTCGFHF